jgi:hypothetical protein
MQVRTSKKQLQEWLDFENVRLDMYTQHTAAALLWQHYGGDKQDLQAQVSNRGHTQVTYNYNRWQYALCAPTQDEIRFIMTVSLVSVFQRSHLNASYCLGMMKTHMQSVICMG